MENICEIIAEGWDICSQSDYSQELLDLHVPHRDPHCRFTGGSSRLQEENRGRTFGGGGGRWGGAWRYQWWWWGFMRNTSKTQDCWAAPLLSHHIAVFDCIFAQFKHLISLTCRQYWRQYWRQTVLMFSLKQVRKAFWLENTSYDEQVKKKRQVMEDHGCDQSDGTTWSQRRWSWSCRSVGECCWAADLHLHFIYSLVFIYHVIIWVSVKCRETICIVIDAIQIKLNRIEFTF